MSRSAVAGPCRDAWLGLGVMVTAGAYLWLARSIEPSLLDDVVGPRGVPTLLGVAALACGAMLATRTLQRRRTVASATATGATDSRPRDRTLAPIVTLLVGVGYAVVLPLAGYGLSIFALLATMSAYHGGSVRREGLVVAVAGAAVFWGLFVWLLRIPQPGGLWTDGR
jgi:hypothetical protein